MLTSTLEATKAIMRADPSIAPSERARILAAICRPGENEGPSAPKPEAPQVLTRRAVAQRLAKSTRTVDNLARAGYIRRVILPGRKRGGGFLATDVNRLLIADAAGERVGPALAP